MNTAHCLLNEESDSSDSEYDFILSCVAASSVFQEERKWQCKYVKDRPKHGEFHTLFDKLSSDQFQNYFRLTRSEFEFIHDLICEDIRKQDTNYRKAIGTREKLAICLRYLASGDCYKSLEFSYRVGHRTVSRAVEEVCDALWIRLQPTEMPDPSADMLKNSAERFKLKWNFDHCMGAIDGKHIQIKAPPKSGSSYFNYKKTFSIVLLAVVDDRFSMIDVGSKGRFSDGGIFSSSFIGRRLRQGINLPEDEPLYEGGSAMPYVVVGDEAFPLLKLLMRPYPGKRLPTEETIFNYRLSRARSISENAFGILSSRWRVLHKPFEIKIETVDKVVKAICVLHNYLTKINSLTSIEGYSSNLSRIQGAAVRATSEAFNIRNSFKQYFNSTLGEVSWQWDYV